MGSGGGGGDGGGFLFSDKGEMGDCDVGLGLKTQRGGAPDSAPQLKSNHMHVALTHDTPFHGFPQPSGVGAPHQSPTPFTTIHDAAGASGAAASSSGQEQKTYVPTCSFPADSSFKSWAGDCSGCSGVVGGGVPFTASQRQELERQTAIYKHIMSSASVPPELLLPFTDKYTSDVPFASSSKYPNDQCSRDKFNSLDLRFSSSGKDPEPWRCRRTDGKKWRCSRDVAPDQKYCERHTHKGRPSRSRKPVESPSRSQLSHPCNTSAFSSPASASRSTLVDQSIPSVESNYQNQRSYLLNQASQYNQTRYSDWLMKREAAAAALPLTPPALYQSLDQVVHSGDDQLRENCASFADKFSFLPPQGKHVLEGGSEQSQGMNQQSCLLPRQFLDTWSLGENRGGHIVEITRNSSSNANLTLSMSAMASRNSDQSGQCKSRVGEGPSWMSPVIGGGSSWMSSPPGGPLAEALCLGIASGVPKGSDGASAHGCSSSTSTASSSKSLHDDGSNGRGEGGLSFLQ